MSTDESPNYRILDRPRTITFMGGGMRTVGYLPKNYSDAITGLLRELDDDVWQDWWASTGLPPCEIWHWVGEESGARIRKTASKVKAEIFQSLNDVEALKTDRAAISQLARADVENALAGLQQRFGLPPWPNLPDDPFVQSSTRTYLAQPPAKPTGRQRRRNLTSVDVYPDSSHQNPDDDYVFAARCSPIYELYSLALKAGEPIKATASWMRIFVNSNWPAELPTSIDEEPADGYGFSESQGCAPDKSILDAPRDQWSRLYLDWLHGRMLLTARARGWDEAPLEAARQWCLDKGIKLELSNKPKSSPDRRFRAQLSLLMDVDGMRHLTLAVTSKSGDLIASTTEVFEPFFVSVQQFRAMSRHLRWLSPTTVFADDRWRVGDLPWNPGICKIELGLPEEDLAVAPPSSGRPMG